MLALTGSNHKFTPAQLVLMEDLQLPNYGDETAAQRQARIRRERREAKIKAGGSARLDKITSVSGRPIELGASA